MFWWPIEKRGSEGFRATGRTQNKCCHLNPPSSSCTFPPRAARLKYLASGGSMEKTQRMDLLESEEGCNLQPLFSSPVSTTQVSTRPGLNSGQSWQCTTKGLSQFPHKPPHTPQSSDGTAPSLEAVTPRGTPGLSLHSSPGPLTPSLLPSQLPLSHWLADAMSSPTQGTVMVFAWSHQPVQASDWLACHPHQLLEVCVWCCPFPDITLME